MPPTVFERIESLLTSRGVPFSVARHRPVFTSQEAAEVRGTPLVSGATALICKGDQVLAMFVMPADRKPDRCATRPAIGRRQFRFPGTENEPPFYGVMRWRSTLSPGRARSRP
jgi:hypothetical protein